MSKSSTAKQTVCEKPSVPIRVASNQTLRVFACVDTSSVSARVVPHARAIAQALGGALSLLHVVEPGKSHAPFDPVEWDIRKRQAHMYVSRLAKRFGDEADKIAVKLLEGRSADQIGECTAGRVSDITALCSNDDLVADHIGETARGVLENSASSILLVPSAVPEVEEAIYRRILVSLDGSPRSESAISTAVRIAVHQNAELILIHATPTPEFLRNVALEPEDVELYRQLSQRNDLAARKYLDRIRQSLANCDVVVRTVILKNGDVRRLLAEAIIVQSADLLVMSSHGHSGYGDVPSGDVSRFILSRSHIPVLMVRTPGVVGADHICSSAESKGARRPLGSAG